MKLFSIIIIVLILHISLKSQTSAFEKYDYYTQEVSYNIFGYLNTTLVFPGNYNIPDNGYATLEGLFSLAPWLYLFLVPAITMRMFADEKRSGTIEILLTRPVSDFQVVLAKFFAGLVLVVFSLLPTLLYFLSVYLLGNPVGSIDAGATWGSFFGLFFLAIIYVAIGIFASSLSDNQIVSFILAIALSFVSSSMTSMGFSSSTTHYGSTVGSL